MMPAASIHAYMERLPALKAEYSFMLSETAMMPWMKENERRRIFRQWRLAIGDYAERPRVTKGQLALIGIRMEYAPKPG